MTRALLAAAAIAVAACHSRNENEVGAAPETDTTGAVTHVIDSTRTGPPGTAGRPPDATVTLDSVVSDTVDPQPIDSSEWSGETPVSTPQDTLGPSRPEPGWRADSAAADTSGEYR